jgi:hypothetical protein
MYVDCFVFVLSAASPNLTPSSGKSSSKKVPILLSSIGGAALLAVMCFILFCLRIRHRKNYDRTGEIVYVFVIAVYLPNSFEFVNLVVL